MKEMDRRSVRALLACVEVTMSDARDIPAWWDELSAEDRHEWLEFQAKVRSYQHELQDPQ